MESLSLLQFKWDYGVYDLDYMIYLVDEGHITPEQFHEITRYNYYGVKNTKNGREQSRPFSLCVETQEIVS